MFIDGITFLVFFMAIGAGYGWWRGIRDFLTVTLASVFAYLLFVSSENLILDVLNRAFVNIPILIGIILQILTGSNQGFTQPFQPIIADPLTLPLLLRVVLFLAFITLGIIFNNQAWTVKGPSKNTVAKLLGAISGTLTALIWVGSATIFWQQSGAQGGLIGNFLAILPDATGWIPGLMLALVVIILVSITLHLPRLVKS